MGRAVVVTVLSLMAGCAWAQQQYPIVGEPLVVQDDEALFYADGDWVRTVVAPQVAADEGIVMFLQARMKTPKGTGGCNWLLQVKIDGVILREGLLRPRLLNKPARFHLLNTQHDFDWYHRGHQAWMTMFADGYDYDMTDAQDDFGYLWDLTDLVRPGQQFELRLVYAQKGLPQIVGHDAPIGVRNLWLAGMKLSEMQNLRAQVLAARGDRQTVPVRATVPADEGPGEVAYELAWSGRAEQPRGQVGFEDLRGWTAWTRGEVQVSIGASREQRLWREQVLKISCEPGEGPGMLFLQSPQPIEISGEWDAVELWAYFSHGKHLRPSPPVMVTALIEDSRGREYEIRLGDLNTQYWYVVQGLLSRSEQAMIAWPARFVGLLLDRIKQPEGAVIYLHSLAFYRQQRQPYAVSPRPAQPSFPTSEDGGLPTPPAGAVCSVDPGPREFAFTCAWPAGRLTYLVTPESGSFDDLSVSFVANGRTVRLTPMSGGGLEFDCGVPVIATGPQVQKLDARMEGQSLATRWRFSRGEVSAEYEIRYRLHGATLVVDVSCAGGAARGVRFGKVVGLSAPRAYHVPYLKMGNPPDPLVACGDGLFVGAITDWRNSDYSRSDTEAKGVLEDGVSINNGTTYLPLTDGRRNDLHDRLLVTVSPDFHDLLPNIPNPPSPNLDETARYMYVMSSGPNPNLWRIMKRHGLDDLIAMHFAGIWWRMAGEGFSMRNRPRPEMTLQELSEYRDYVRGLGFVYGILMEYGDFFPLNEFWDPNLLSLTPEGAWRTRWIGHYATKPIALAHLARVNGERLQANCGLEAVYLDTHTNHGLNALDYEAGVPGAGKAAAEALAVGEMLLEARRLHGITCSEGIYRWLYAGLVDLDYATWVGPKGSPWQEPILPDFALLKIHPLTPGTGMGYNPTAFFGKDNQEATTRLYGDSGEPLAPAEYYQYLAATLAHGHSAILGYSYYPPLNRMIHYYATLMALQPEYLTDTVVEIMRHDGERYLTTSEALQRGVLETGRVRIRYSRGLTVWVNYHGSERWQVEVNGKLYTLPPWGFVAEKPGELLAFSAELDGHRVDYARCPRWTYLSGCGEQVQYDGISTDGAVWVRYEGGGTRVIPCGRLPRLRSARGEQYPYQSDCYLGDVPEGRGCTELRIAADKLLPGSAPQALKFSARDYEGIEAPAQVQVGQDGVISFTTSAEVVDWMVSR